MSLSQSVDRSHGKDSGNPRSQHAFEAIEEIPEDDDETHLNDDCSENDDPFVDEDGNFLATEDVVSDVDDDLAIDDDEYHEELLGNREAQDLMKEARVARGFYLVVVPIRSDKPTGRGNWLILRWQECVEWQDWSWQGRRRIERCWTIFRLSWPHQERER